MERNTLKNARFWTLINGDWIKITLAPGETLEYSHSECTDEGFRSEYQAWHHCPDTGEVYRELYTRERDCDGMFERSCEQVAAPDRLASVACVEYVQERGYGRYVDSDTMFRPDWQDLDSYQRDHSAEAMGY